MLKLKDTISKILNVEDRSISQENANLNGSTTSGMQQLVVGEVLKDYAMNNLLGDEKVRHLFQHGVIHIHDFDHYALGTKTCTQIRLDKVLEGGYTTNGAYSREAQSITVAMAHAAIILQANQNQEHGGQAYANFDFDLAPYVTKSYNKHFNSILEKPGSNFSYEAAEKEALRMTEKETFEACEAFVHNMNTMNGSRGGQSVFSSINFGLDISWEGRLITKSMLEAMISGLGNGDTAIYPICVFKVQKGINRYKGDPNYDLYKLAHFATSKRLFPNYVNCDASFNHNSTGDPKNEIATMGCRTRVFENVNGINTPVGRGNASFTTINLPLLAQMCSGNLESFYIGLADILKVVSMQLLERLEYQRGRKMGTFDFLYGQGGYNIGDNEYDPNELVGDILDNATLGIGFIGLAEACYILGETDYKSDDHFELKKTIVKLMYDTVEEFKEDSGLNFSLLATPSEGLAEKSMKKFKDYIELANKTLGTDFHYDFCENEFFTNSFHVPVWVDATAGEKIDHEAVFHKYTLGGHISYIELDAKESQDLERIEEMIEYMLSKDMGYFSINVPVDRCTSCGYSEPIEGDQCPICGGANISRVRRITGYLVGNMDRWNNGKKDEESKRVKHGMEGL